MASIVDFRRYHGLIAVGIPMALLACAINQLLLITTGPSPEWLVPAQQPMPWKQVELAEAQAKGLALATHSSTGEDLPFLLYLGMSTAGEGIEPKLLADPGSFYGNRVAGLCGSGGSMDRFRSLAEPLFRYKVRPQLTLLCIDAAWLVGHPSEAPPGSLSLVEAVRSRDRLQFRRWLSRHAWIRKNRTSINHAIRTFLFALRIRLDIIPANRDPWEAPERQGYPVHARPDFLRYQLANLQGYGWFDANSYALHQQAQGDALRNIIKELQKRGSEVVIVLMPEQSEIRNRIPAVAYDFLEQTLASDVDVAVLPIWKFVDAIPDEMFSDYFHMNDAGRFEFSTQLANRLRTHLASKEMPTIGQ